MKDFGVGIRKISFLVLSILAGLFLWQMFTTFSQIPSFIFPKPIEVWEKLIIVLQDGSLLKHALITLQEVLFGLMLGLSAAIITGYFLAKSRFVERVLSPYIVASQSIPIVAIAPLLVIWLGPGILSKILTSALIVFFPVLVNTVVGLKSVPRELYDLMRSLQANTWQRIIKLEIPAAMPVFLGGLRIGATLSVIGAVVGEFVGADKGLGFLVNVGRGLYDTALVFVAVFTIVLLSLGLYGSVIFIENRLLSWQKRNGD
ncbi:MAG TPA: ABC transporter permease [Chloroflexi bacterium]|nr:ABC transporter permease [Chloroflexota bacterium]